MRIGDDLDGFGFTAMPERSFLSSTDAKMQQCVGAIAMSKPSGSFELHADATWGDPQRGIELQGGGSARVQDEEGNSLRFQASQSSNGRGSMSLRYEREMGNHFPLESDKNSNSKR